MLFLSVFLPTLPLTQRFPANRTTLLDGTCCCCDCCCLEAATARAPDAGCEAVVTAAAILADVCLSFHAEINSFWCLLSPSLSR